MGAGVFECMGAGVFGRAWVWVCLMVCGCGCVLDVWVRVCSDMRECVGAGVHGWVGAV